MEPEPTPREAPQVATGTVLWLVGGIVVFLILIGAGFQLLFVDRVHRAKPEIVKYPSPTVVADERALRRNLENRQNAELEGSGGRLPIDAAMAAIAAKRAHAFDPVGGD